MYLVAALVLTLGEYAANDVVPTVMELRPGTEQTRFYRKVGWVSSVAFLYLVPPYIYARMVLGLGLRDLGLRLEGFREHLPMYLGFFGIVLPFVAFFSAEPHFQRTYPLSPQAANHLHWLLIWEIMYGIQFIGVEFFFRGFMLFGGVRLLGPYVIPAMVVPYCMLHFAKPWPETLGSIIAGSTLGVVALRTRSIVAGICIHAAVAWSMDFAALYRAGDLGRLLGW